MNSLSNKSMLQGFMTRRYAILIILVMVFILIMFLWNSFSRSRRRISGAGLQDPSHHETISELAEIIIPKTDTPGAKEAGVGVYILNVFESCLSDRDKRTIVEGLDDLEEYCQKKNSLSFKNCTQEQKVAVVEYFQKKGVIGNQFLNKVKNKLIGPSFFELIKRLTVTGYCSSKIGATQGLVYDHIPVHYKPCIPLAPRQHSWATT